jgi:hypothetical protein
VVLSSSRRRRSHRRRLAGFPCDFFLLGDLRDQRSVVRSRLATDAAFCSAVRDLGRIDDAGLEHVDVLSLSTS